MFGNVKSRRQNEKTNFEPVSPYAVSKLHSHWMINVYRMLIIYIVALHII